MGARKQRALRWPELSPPLSRRLRPQRSVTQAIRGRFALARTFGCGAEVVPIDWQFYRLNIAWASYVVRDDKWAPIRPTECLLLALSRHFSLHCTVRFRG